MEVNKVSVVCLVLVCVAFTSVQSASFYYRTGRELEVPVENEIIREEIIAELKREPEVTAAEPIAVILEEVPVAQLIKEAPAADVQEPVAIISEKDDSNTVNEEAIVLRSAGAETNIPVVVEEKIASVPIVEEPVAVAAVEDDIPKTRNEPIIEAVEKVTDPVGEVQTEAKVTPVEVVHVAVKSNPIEETVAVETENVVYADAPVVEKDEAIRQSEGDATTTRPNVIQVITHQIQNLQTQFQNQIQSVFNPNAANAASTSANEADSAGSSTARPTLIAQFQQAVGPFFNRPAGSPGPIQGIVSAVQTNFQTAQTNFQGLFRPGSATTAPTTVPIVVAPVDPVVGEKTMLGEVPVVNEPAAVVEKVEEKETEVKSD